MKDLLLTFLQMMGIGPLLAFYAFCIRYGWTRIPTKSHTEVDLKRN